MARVRVLTMKFPRVTKIGQSIASMRTTPQVSGLGPVTVYIARFKCRAGLDPDRAYLFQLGSAHQKVAPGRARSTRLHCQLFCRAVLDPGRALSNCGSVNVAIHTINFNDFYYIHSYTLCCMTAHEKQLPVINDVLYKKKLNI